MSGGIALQHPISLSLFHLPEIGREVNEKMAEKLIIDVCGH